MKFVFITLFGILMFASTAHAEFPCAKDSLGRTVCQPDGTNALVKKLSHSGTTGGAGCTQDANGQLACDDTPQDSTVPLPPVSPVASPDETGMPPLPTPTR